VKPLLVLLCILDVLITAIILKHGGIELNPLAAFLYDEMDLYGLIFLKAISIMIVLWACNLLDYKERQWVLFIGCLFNFIAVAVGCFFLWVIYG